MYVYFVKAWGECPLIKIGKANDPLERVRKLQTGCPFKLKLMGMVKCRSEYHALQVEKFTHELFRKQRRRGEWFRLSASHEQAIKDVIREALNRTARLASTPEPTPTNPADNTGSGSARTIPGVPK